MLTPAGDYQSIGIYGNFKPSGELLYEMAIFNIFVSDIKR